MGFGLGGEVGFHSTTCSSVALAKRDHLSEPQFPHYEMGIMTPPT